MQVEVDAPHPCNYLVYGSAEARSTGFDATALRLRPPGARKGTGQKTEASAFLTLTSHPMFSGMENPMIVHRAIALLTLTSVLALPLCASGQETAAQRRHRRAAAAQKASDHQHHTGAKIVVGSAAGGEIGRAHV